MVSLKTSFLKKLKHFFYLYSFADFLRKCIHTINKHLAVHHFFRGLRAWYYFRNLDVTIGKNVRIHGISFKMDLKKNISFYDNVIIEFGARSELKIGNNCLFSYGVLLAINEKLCIGDNVQIGEYTSIRDSSHKYDRLDVPMRLAGDFSSPVHISNDVWIGRGCIILPGTEIEEGVVIGANSVVKGVLLKNGVYAGCPARLIKYRTDLV